MCYRLRYLGLLCGMLLLCSCESDDKNPFSSPPALTGKYYVVDLNGAGFIHDTISVTFDSALDIRLSSSDGRLLDSPLGNVQQSDYGDYTGFVALENGVPGSVADVSIDQLNGGIGVFRIAHGADAAVGLGSRQLPWSGALAGSLHNGDGSLAGTFSAQLAGGNGSGVVDIDALGHFTMNGTFADLGLGHFYTNEGWPTTGVSMLGWLWAETPPASVLHGSGTWENAEGTASGTWTAD